MSEGERIPSGPASLKSPGKIGLSYCTMIYPTENYTFVALKKNAFPFKILPLSTSNIETFISLSKIKFEFTTKSCIQGIMGSEDQFWRLLQKKYTFCHTLFRCFSYLCEYLLELFQLSLLRLLFTQQFLTFRCVWCVKIKDTDDILPVKDCPQLP